MRICIEPSEILGKQKSRVVKWKHPFINSLPGAICYTKQPGNGGEIILLIAPSPLITAEKVHFPETVQNELITCILAIKAFMPSYTEPSLTARQIRVTKTCLCLEEDSTFFFLLPFIGITLNLLILIRYISELSCNGLFL